MSGYPNCASSAEGSAGPALAKKSSSPGQLSDTIKEPRLFEAYALCYCSYARHMGS